MLNLIYFLASLLISVTIAAITSLIMSKILKFNKRETKRVLKITVLIVMVYKILLILI